MSPFIISLAGVVAFCLASDPASAATDTVSVRQPLQLQGGDTMASAQGKFVVGLFSSGRSGRFYLGIWYKNVPVQTVIWVGNRANPLSSAASAELRVSSDDGNLELVGLSGPSAAPGVVWSSNLSSSATTATWSSSTAAIPPRCCGRASTTHRTRWCRRRGSGRTS